MNIIKYESIITYFEVYHTFESNIDYESMIV